MTIPSAPHPTFPAGNHKAYMEYASEQARLSPPAPTKFCVGAVLVDADQNQILSTGYSMEPCNKRLSGSRTCVQRILALGSAIKVIYVGIREPEKFIGENTGRKRLEDAGVLVEFVEGMEDEIMKVSTAGH
ncbi:putative DRAP deaminase [Aspergillus ibericus CBS 121593]|uniref:CMP/dCMP-type deaminase domain-containing protein n=1 Tax=Aspergillus ibericus CBS 121593 TaxID=1448316 RepID=A0A395GJZ1_9EURO|nr:hypothetical protein BO80DRAFT_249498 [Aspergillus ibericus CBS 121593]RAK95714.1 hypothetical protein BO80DRAFT_249498 [Aspergillus ibericus CBS 121593]